MTKEITKAIILQEIQDKLKLREYKPGPFLFSEEVIPIYNVEPHLIHHYTDTKIVSITSATGFTFFSVPMDERWTVARYMVIFQGAGAIKIAGAYIVRKNATSGAFMYLDLTKNQVDSYLVNLPVPVVLAPGDKINVTCDDYTSTQNLRLDIDVDIEEIR